MKMFLCNVQVHKYVNVLMHADCTLYSAPVYALHDIRHRATFVFSWLIALAVRPVPFAITDRAKNTGH